MKTIIYVDGLNLFHGILQGSSYFWLDIKKLCERILPSQCEIIKVKYFTTFLDSSIGDARVARAHNVHIRALEAHIREFEYLKGYFKKNPNKNIVKMPLDEEFRQEHGIVPEIVKVLKREEKGTDVNIATHILNDAWLDAYDCAVLISNDGDLAEALRLIKLHHSNKEVALISPIDPLSIEQDENMDLDKAIRKKVVKKLSKSAKYKYIITRDDNDIKKSQLPNEIPKHKISKPKKMQPAKQRVKKKIL